MTELPKLRAERQTLAVKTQVLGDNLLPSLRKKNNLHSKNPYKIKKPNPLRKIERPERILDGFYILERSKCEFPHEVVDVRLVDKNLIDVVESDLAYFENLTRVDLSENFLKDIRKITALKALVRLDIQKNGIEDLNFEEADTLDNLKELDIAYNRINILTMPTLSVFPKLRNLNLMGNELTELPPQMDYLMALEVLNLSSNLFNSSHKASDFWASISSIPNLKDLDVSRNQLRGIHTEKLKPGDFNLLERLDFSFNQAENQHNLISTRNFKSLKFLVITGNPFGYLAQHKGLEKEIYMRVGAILINEAIDIPYLKKQKKAKLPIRFTNLYTIQPDDIKKEVKNTFFGVELPPEEMGVVEKPETPVQEEEEEEVENTDQARFFITEDDQKLNKMLKIKGEKKYNQIENGIEEDYEERDENYEENKNNSQEQYNREGASGQEEEDYSEGREFNVNLEDIKSLEDFKKMASALIGDSKDYEGPLEINTAYKLLRQVVKKSSGNDRALENQLNKSLKNSLFKQNVNNKGKPNAVQARMLDVEFLIDELNKKMSTSSLNNNLSN